MFAAIDQAGVAGFVVLQLFTHMEPVWVRPDARGRVSLRKLYRMVEATKNGTPVRVISTPSNRRAERLLKDFGFKDTGVKAWVKSL